MIEYMICRTSFSFVIPIIVFSVLKTYKLLNEKYKMKKNFLVILLALLSGILMSFTINKEDNERVYKIYDLNSDLIYVDGKKATPGMIISLKSHIRFIHPAQWIEMYNMGKDIEIFCQTHKRNEIWKKQAYRKIGLYNRQETRNLFWWITRGATSSKGIEAEYVVKDEISIKIEDPIINTTEQYYEFIVNDGKYKGSSFIAEPDDTDSVIWVSRELLQKNGIILDNNNEFDSLNFKVIYHNYGETFIINNSMTIIFTK